MRFTHFCEYLKVSCHLLSLCGVLLFSGKVNGQGIAASQEKKAARFSVKFEAVKPAKAATDTNFIRAAPLVTVRAGTLLPSIITFVLPIVVTADANNDITPGATSTNSQTPITYTSSNASVAIITANGLIHIVGLGVTYITASQSGNTNYSPATPVMVKLVVSFPQEITFPAIAVKSTCDADFSALATSNNPSNPLTYSSSNTAVATITAQGVIHITGAGTTMITASQANVGLYILAATPQPQTLTVNAPLVPVVSISTKDQSICTGSPATFSANVSNAGPTPGYQWQVNGVNAGTNSAEFTTTAINSATIIQCIVTADDDCKQSTTSNQIQGILVQPYVSPAVSIQSSATAPVCSGASITYTATPVNGGADPGYQWQVNGADAGVSSPVFTGNTFSQGDVVTCIITNNAGGCLTALTAVSNSISVSLIPPQDPAPAVMIASSARNDYLGTPITFTATPENTSGLIVTGYQWMVNGKNTGPDDPVFTTNTLNNADTVTCTITLSNSCIVAATSLPDIVTILPLPAVIIPNTFTPNGDGINDIWNIANITYYPNCLVNIYTRWGVMIFQSRGYNVAWDGNYNGKQLPVGTYYYVISLNNNTKLLSGYVVIIR